jgi:hypothetical protein
MGIFKKKSAQIQVDKYHGNLSTQHWTATCGFLKWQFEVETHTDNPPSIRYRWIAGDRNRITETTFVTALRLLHGAYGWRYIEIVDKDERDRAALVSDEELKLFKNYERASVNEWSPPLFGFGEPMVKG